jgi:hypothetical protein
MKQYYFLYTRCVFCLNFVRQRCYLPSNIVRFYPKINVASNMSTRTVRNVITSWSSSQQRTIFVESLYGPLLPRLLYYKLRRSVSCLLHHLLRVHVNRDIKFTLYTVSNGKRMQHVAAHRRQGLCQISLIYMFSYCSLYVVFTLTLLTYVTHSTLTPVPTLPR